VQGGYAYLCAVIDWHSRCVLAWELSNTLDACFCVPAVARARARHGAQQIFNTDQGCQFTSAEFTQPPLAAYVKLSMDGKGRCLDNVFVERLWRSVKHEEVYLKTYPSLIEAHAGLLAYFRFYNERRPRRDLPHLTAGGRQPMKTLCQTRRLAAPCGNLWLLPSGAANRLVQHPSLTITVPLSKQRGPHQ
jgi:putative transposase